MVTTLGQWWNMLRVGVGDQITQVFYAPWLKSCMACVGMVVTEHFGINHVVLYLYMVLLAFDLLAGVIKSVVWKTFSIRRIYWWFLKFGTHMILFLLFGILYMMTRLVTGLDIPSIVDYIILILSFTEVISIINNGIKAGFPVNPIVIKIIKKMRYKAYRNLMCHFETDEIEPDMEDALAELESSHSEGCRRNGVAQDSGERRRRSDHDVRETQPPDHMHDGGCL